ncbi:hypothetical protein [Acetobacter lambici]|uniref:Polysaccharide chain length determinant N-terminal domain-containing protein n=1 Tax=Acetobacter lambici TaxID=1332824 RepID=A0ABT1F2G5_9PROT|nr:hypothetical protein [Acetobacter lambici]MCP1243413.1 hypothetical protein [Acetobacter lambici]MCP1259412.1 hypothetical protein [Acetobacter lambici]
MTATQIFYKKRLFWSVCGIPSLASAFYLFVWATPRYESEAIVRVYAFSGDSSSGGGAGLGGQASPGAYIFKEIAESWECFHNLGTNKLSSHWAKGDFLSRFGGLRTLLSSNQMSLWNYYRSHVIASVNDESGLVRLNVEGYDPNFSYEVNSNVLEFAQKQLQSSGIRAYQTERTKLEEHVKSDREKLATDLSIMESYQKQYGIADYDVLYKNTLELINKFQEIRVTLDSKATAAQFFAQRSQELAMLKAQLTTLDHNIEDQSSYIKHHLSENYEKFSELKQSILEDVNVIQMDDQNLQDIEQLAYRSSYHVDIVESSVRPSDATMPKALLWAISIMAMSYVAYLVVK